MQKTEERMTERQFLRILASSVCGIILCLVGLVGTSWAWYSMDIVSTDNVIQVGLFDVAVTVESDGTVLEPEGEGYVLSPGTYELTVICRSDNTAPGYCAVRVWETPMPDVFDDWTWDHEAKTAALYPVDPEGDPTVLTFRLVTEEKEVWLEILPLLGVPSGEDLLTEGSTFTIEEALPPEENGAEQ